VNHENFSHDSTAEIRTKYLPNRNLHRCSYPNNFGW